jgi:hypothetical protein
VLHNGDADLWCFIGIDIIVAPMMQRNHRDLHLVLGIRLGFRWRWVGLVSFWPSFTGIAGVSGPCLNRHRGLIVAGASGLVLLPSLTRV